MVGGSAGNSAEGYRDVTAYMVEGVFPILDWMELSAAFRADDYSDFGNATSPRVGINVAITGLRAACDSALHGVKASVLPTCRICTARLRSPRRRYRLLGL